MFKHFGRRKPVSQKDCGPQWALVASENALVMDQLVLVIVHSVIGAPSILGASLARGSADSLSSGCWQDVRLFLRCEHQATQISLCNPLFMCCHGLLWAKYRHDGGRGNLQHLF